MAIFSKFFGDVITLIIRKNADKRIKIILVTFQLEILSILLSVFYWPVFIDFKNQAQIDRREEMFGSIFNRGLEFPALMLEISFLTFSRVRLKFEFYVGHSY